MSKLIAPSSPAVLRPDHPAWGLLDKLRKAFDVAHDAAEPTARVRMERRAFLGRALRWGGGLMLGPAVLDLLTPQEALAAFTGFSSTSNYIRLASGLLTTGPLTVSFEFWPASASSGTAWFMGASGSSGDNNLYKAIVGGGAVAVFRQNSATGSTAATSANTATTSAWNHYIGGVDSTDTNRWVILNGGTKATNSLARVPSGVNRTTIGKRDNGSNDQPFSGAIAEWGMWNVDMTSETGVQAALAGGFSPLTARPQNLVAYLPLVRALIDLKGNAFAINGSLTQAGHPRVFMPN